MFLVFRVVDPPIYEIIWGHKMISGLSRLSMIGYLSYKVSENYGLVERVKKLKNLFKEYKTNDDFIEKIISIGPDINYQIET